MIEMLIVILIIAGIIGLAVSLIFSSSYKIRHRKENPDFKTNPVLIKWLKITKISTGCLLLSIIGMVVFFPKSKTEKSETSVNPLDPQGDETKQEVFEFVTGLDSNFKNVDIYIDPYKKYCITIKAHTSSLWGGTSDWWKVSVNAFETTKEISLKYKDNFSSLCIIYDCKKIDKYGNESTGTWAKIYVNGQEAAKINWDKMDELQFARNFIEYEAKALDSREWLADFYIENKINRYR